MHNKIKSFVLLLGILFSWGFSTWPPQYDSKFKDLAISPNGNTIVLSYDGKLRIKRPNTIQKNRDLKVCETNDSITGPIIIDFSDNYTLWGAGNENVYTTQICMMLDNTTKAKLSGGFLYPFITLKNNSIIGIHPPCFNNNYSSSKSSSVIKVHLTSERELIYDTLLTLDTSSIHHVEKLDMGLLITQSYDDSLLYGATLSMLDELDHLDELGNTPDFKLSPFANSMDRPIYYITDNSVDTIWYKRKARYSGYNEESDQLIFQDYGKSNYYTRSLKSKRNSETPLPPFRAHGGQFETPNGQFVINVVEKTWIGEGASARLLFEVQIKKKDASSSWQKLFTFYSRRRASKISVSNKNIGILTKYDEFFFYDSLEPGATLYEEDHFDKTRMW